MRGEKESKVNTACQCSEFPVFQHLIAIWKSEGGSVQLHQYEGPLRFFSVINIRPTPSLHSPTKGCNSFAQGKNGMPPQMALIAWVLGLPPFIWMPITIVRLGPGGGTECGLGPEGTPLQTPQGAARRSPYPVLCHSVKLSSPIPACRRRQARSSPAALASLISPRRFRQSLADGQCR